MGFLYSIIQYQPCQHHGSSMCVQMCNDSWAFVNASWKLCMEELCHMATVCMCERARVSEWVERETYKLCKRPGARILYSLNGLWNSWLLPLSNIVHCKNDWCIIAYKYYMHMFNQILFCIIYIILRVSNLINNIPLQWTFYKYI